jgi:hypothetical protein
MIVFLVSPEHDYTLRALIGAEPGLDIKMMHYGKIPALRSIPRATYIFTDLDRLPTEMLGMSAQLYIQVRDQGATVLNNPARVLSRSGLLRALFLAGANGFNAYRVEEGILPQRWPVFLRTEGTHAGPLPELFETAEALQAAIERAVAGGLPRSRLLIVEFMAEPVRPGLYRKLSCFRVGQSSVAHTCVHDTQWIAKDGKLGITPPELYDDELRIVRENPYGPSLAKAFDIAGIEYGRIDFGLIGSEIQTYEINTNPHIKLDAEHPSPVRRESMQVFTRNLLAALKTIDTPPE